MHYIALVKALSKTMIQISAPNSLYDLAFNYLIGLEQISKADILQKTNHTELVILFADALSYEAYEICADIKSILQERGEQLPSLQ